MSSVRWRKGGHIDADDVEPEIQVFPETLFASLVPEVTIGGRQHPHINMNRRIRTNPLHLALLESAQKLGLQRNGHFADFIKKERSAIGLDKAAVPPSFRACKRAFLMAEQFGFEQVLGKGRAVYRNQRFCGARTGPVQGSRHQLLARAGFSSNKDCRFRGRNGFDKSEHGLHGRALAQNLRVLSFSLSWRLSSRFSTLCRERSMLWLSVSLRRSKSSGFTR